MAEIPYTPRPEYPRPQMVRDSYKNLNGTWRFLFDFGNSGMERGFGLSENADVFTSEEAKDITVPFCPESPLSGVGYTDFIPAVWYRRTVTLTAEECAKRVLLHFGAVDYHAVIFVNGRNAGEHTGGYASFTLDITDFVTVGENALVVYAEDDTRSGVQPVGKQSDRYASYACSYTRTTGIWQTVWMEFVPDTYIGHLKLTPFVADRYLQIEAELVDRTHSADGKTVTATATYHGREIGTAHGTVCGGMAAFALPVAEIHLWDVGKPELYDLTVTYGEDTVTSYFGMRSVSLSETALCLNGRPVFLRTVLDQGFNPFGVYTAPSDVFLKEEITRSMALGFNGARLHQRVFEERTLYWADRLGYLVFGEYANGQMASDGRGIGYFLPEWMETVKRDYNHPSIIGWCPENESYWRKDIDGICQKTFYAVTKQYDPYRPVIDASGGLHFVTDMFDIHDYEQEPEKLAASLEKMKEDKTVIHNPCHNDVLTRHVYRGEPYWVSEYGGTYWNPEDKNGWGYGSTPADEEAFAKRYEGLTTVLLSHPRVCGFCYTQLTDVEQERNGLYRYGRQRKFSRFVYDRIRAANMQTAAVEKTES